MTLKERINEDMKAAMRAGETGKRDAIRLMEAGEQVNADAVRYLNRLSDHLFCAARRANANGAADILWKPGATR